MRVSSYLVQQCFALFVRSRRLLPPSLRSRVDALSAVQDEAEIFIIQVLREANLLTLHGKRVTVQLRVMQLVCHLMDFHNFFTMKC